MCKSPEYIYFSLNIFQALWTTVIICFSKLRQVQMRGTLSPHIHFPVWQLSLCAWLSKDSAVKKTVPQPRHGYLARFSRLLLASVERWPILLRPAWISQVLACWVISWWLVSVTLIGVGRAMAPTVKRAISLKICILRAFQRDFCKGRI